MFTTIPRAAPGRWGRAGSRSRSGVELDYFTGGRDTPDALRHHTASTSASWLLTMQNEHYGANDYLQEVVYRDVTHKDGVLLGWSHSAGWYAAFHGDGHVQIDVHGANGRVLAAGATYALPRAHLLVFNGDLDAAGNDLKEFQYRYKWDQTREAPRHRRG